MIARSRPSRSPKWYCSDVVLRCCASRLISRSDTPSIPRAANSRSAAAISDSGASGDVPFGRSGHRATIPVTAAQLRPSTAPERSTDRRLASSPMGFRDRFFTPTTAKAIVSWRILLGVAAGVGAGLLGVPVLGAAASVSSSTPAPCSLAMPRPPRSPAVDPFTVSEPWRHFVQSAQRSRRQLTETIRATARSAARPPAGHRRPPRCRAPGGLGDRQAGQRDRRRDPRPRPDRLRSRWTRCARSRRRRRRRTSPRPWRPWRASWPPPTA